MRRRYFMSTLHPCQKIRVLRRPVELTANSGLLHAVIADSACRELPGRRDVGHSSFAPKAAQMRKAISTKAQHLRILLVDDEALIRVMVTDMLDELGHSVVAEAGELGHALSLARSTDFDLAILDFNLNGQEIDPVAEAIIARQMPFIFATGYASPSIATRFSQIPRLRKPYGVRDLGSAIDQAIPGGTQKWTVA